MPLSVSFIIPAFNEERHIANTLSSVRQANDVINIAEIVVIDNCSTDNTAKIAEQLGAKVLTVSGGPVSRLRNVGVENSSGDVLIFIDADVSLTAGWYQNIARALEKIEQNPAFATGSHCSVPENTNNWLEKYWFSAFVNSVSSHLGTGHLIMSRVLFLKVGGFSNSLETGEDYDICMRIKAAGGAVEEDAGLKVIHNDFPQTVNAFVKREIWHGKGDSGSLSHIVRSKVALASLVFVAVHFVLLWFALCGNALLLGVAGLFLTIFLFSVSYLKFARHGLKVVFINSFVYYLYFIGRSVAVIKGVFGNY